MAIPSMDEGGFVTRWFETADAGKAQATRSLTPGCVLRVAGMGRRSDPRGLRRARATGGEHLRRRGVSPAGYERAVPQGELASQGAPLDEAPGPFDDLRADRRHLHAG